MIIYEDELNAEAVKRNGSSQHIIKAVVKLSDNEKTITFMDVTGRALKMKTDDVIRVLFNAFCKEGSKCVECTGGYCEDECGAKMEGGEIEKHSADALRA